MNSQDENGSTAGKWLLAAGFAVGVCAGYMHTVDEHKDMASHEAVRAVTSTDQVMQNQMNTDLKDTTIRSDLRKASVQGDNDGVDTLSDVDQERNDQGALIPLVLQQQNSAQDVPRDEMPGSLEPMTPDQRVSLMLQRNQWLRDYDQAYQQEYIQQFLKNAHDHGVNVRLNKNLDVTGLSVNGSNQPLLFPPAATSTK